MGNINIQDKIGISTACFYPELTEKAFDIICGLDVRVCEIFINTHSETRPDYLREIKLKARDNNIRVSAVHPYMSGHEGFLFFTEYDRRRLYDSIDLYKPMFEAAQFLGAGYVIFHGMTRKTSLPIEEYNERFLLVADEARKYNCELLHENIGAVNDYLQDLKDVRFALDFKHSVSWEYDNLEVIEKMGENIAHIHLNDMMFSGGSYKNGEVASKTRDCRLPLAGALDYKKIFEKLLVSNDINYIGDFIIEVYSFSYKSLTEVAESIDKCRVFLKNLGV